MRTRTAELVFVLTENNLHEGGRSRDPHEVCLNVNQGAAAYLGEQEFWCRTETGARFPARISGSNGKNFRSRPVTALGEWLIDGHHAEEGDEVHAQWVGGELLLHFIARRGHRA
jgi:hypothetical protein